jgi:osmotically-inducible protein OsmY
MKKKAQEETKQVERGKPSTPTQSTASLDESHEGRRTLLIVGERPRTDQVEAVLQDLKVTIKKAATHPSSKPHSRPSPYAIIFAGPGAGVELVRVVERYNNSVYDNKITPFFVLVNEGTSDKSVRALYTAGAVSVFEWPSEASRLADLIAEHLGIVFARGVTPERDAALSRTIRAHLRVSSKLPNDLSISTHRGVVELRGEVSTLWRKRELASLIHDIPGVRRVVSDDVRVPPSSRSNEEIEDSIRAVLTATSDVHEETIAVSSNNGFIVLAGSIDDRSEANRITELVTHVRGVRGIELLMTISPAKRTEERGTARRLQRGIDRLLHEGSVTVTVFGDTVVLTGRVRDATARGLAEKFVLRDKTIERVVNKIQYPE